MQLTNEEMARAVLDPSNPLWALLVSPLRSMQRKGAVYLYAGPDALKMMHRWAAGAKGLERCTIMTPRARRLAASVLLALKPIHALVGISSCQEFMAFHSRASMLFMRTTWMCYMMQ